MSAGTLPKHPPLGPEHRLVVVPDDAWMLAAEKGPTAFTPLTGEGLALTGMGLIRFPHWRAYMTTGGIENSTVYRRASDVRKA